MQGIENEKKYDNTGSVKHVITDADKSDIAGAVRAEKADKSVKEYEMCACDVVHSDAVREVSEKILPENEYIALASLFKMFADGTRVHLLHALEVREMCVCDLAALLGVTKSAVSHQLRDLKLASLVKFRREGQNVFYSLADDHVKSIIDIGFDHLHE